MYPKRTIPHDLIVSGSLDDRFWSKVTATEGETACWPYTRKSNHQGYGQFVIEGRIVFAHRVAWALTHRQNVPEGMRVLHRCDNPPCCNPAHLFLGTLSDNMQDMWAKGRHVPPVNKSGRDWTPKGNGRLKGEAHLSARLTTADVLQIREQHSAGVGPTVLGERYGVTKQAIRAIVLRKTWKHV